MKADLRLLLVPVQFRAEGLQAFKVMRDWFFN